MDAGRMDAGVDAGKIGARGARMNLSLANGALPVTAVTAPPPAGKTEKAAREFESVLLTSLFDSLQKSFAFDAQDNDGTPGAGDYRLMGTRALAEAVSEHGGIGIARLILKHLQGPEVPGKEGTKVPSQAKGLGT
jgi:Rod binding domain-containing protein